MGRRPGPQAAVSERRPRAWPTLNRPAAGVPRPHHLARWEDPSGLPGSRNGLNCGGAGAWQPTERAGGGALRLSLPHVVNGLAIGDLDGDGRGELVAISDRQVIAYRWTGRQPELLTTGAPLPILTTYLHIDAGDIDGNGKAEVITAAVRTRAHGAEVDTDVLSDVLGLRDGRLEPLAPPLPRHLRILPRPGSPPVLLTQALGADTPFAGPIETMVWHPGGPRPGGPLSFVTAGLGFFYAFAVGDLDGDGREELALVDADGRLRVHDETGRLRAASDEDLGSGLHRSPGPRHRSFGASPEQVTAWRSVGRRVLMVRDPGGGIVAITLANPRRPGCRAGGGSAPPVAGRAVGYVWDPTTKRPVRCWESADLGGPVLDVAAGPLEADGAVRLVALSSVGEDRFLAIMAPLH